VNSGSCTPLPILPRLGGHSQRAAAGRDHPVNAGRHGRGRSVAGEAGRRHDRDRSMERALCVGLSSLRDERSGTRRRDTVNTVTAMLMLRVMTRYVVHKTSKWSGIGCRQSTRFHEATAVRRPRAMVVL
jgi:hypothetical protein